MTIESPRGIKNNMKQNFGANAFVNAKMFESTEYGNRLTEKKMILDVPDYLFISTNIAKSYPTLMESIIISHYHYYK